MSAFDKTNMVIETLVVTAIATAMLGWNVHVMNKSGVSAVAAKNQVRNRVLKHRRYIFTSVCACVLV